MTVFLSITLLFDDTECVYCWAAKEKHSQFLVKEKYWFTSTSLHVDSTGMKHFMGPIQAAELYRYKKPLCKNITIQL